MTDLTDLIVILDRSGSMWVARPDHEGGLRSFVSDQRKLAGEVRFTFVRFDGEEPFEIVYDRAPLPQVDDQKLTLTPRGNTPLLAAVSLTLDHVARQIPDPADHPVIAMIITDGQENASGPSYSKAKVQTQVQAREAAGWKVLYLGANVDEFAEAKSLGVSDMKNSMGYAGHKGTQSMYTILNANVGATRGAATAGQTLDAAYANLNFTDAQRTDAKTDDAGLSVSNSPTTSAGGKV